MRLSFAVANLSLSDVHSYEEFYPEGPKNSKSLARIVGVHHAKRIKGLLDNTKGTIVLGGETDVENTYIAPTVVKDVKDGDVVFAWTWNNRVGNREFYMNW